MFITTYVRPGEQNPLSPGLFLLYWGVWTQYSTCKKRDGYINKFRLEIWTLSHFLFTVFFWQKQSVNLPGWATFSTSHLYQLRTKLKKRTAGMYGNVPSRIRTRDSWVIRSMSHWVRGHINARKVVCQKILFTKHGPVSAKGNIKLTRFSPASTSAISTETTLQLIRSYTAWP
jgi:hypothetical protein